VTAHRVAVLLLNHGAADSLPGVPTFLGNIFGDLDIIRLPGGGVVQRRLAALIVHLRAPKVQYLYRFMGGGSPLVPYMRAQAGALEARFADDPDVDVDVHLALRYYTPSIEEALVEVLASGVRDVVAFPQYPQYSDTTVGSCMNQFARAVEAVPGAEDLDVAIVPAFGADPAYVKFLAGRVRQAMEAAPNGATLLFSAHSIPMKSVREGDPYPDECAEQAALVAAAAGVDSWELAYQSRSGPVAWLTPDLPAHVESLMDDGRRHFVVVPLSFVQDHLETLVELDVQLATEIERRGGTIVRVRAANNAPEFADLSAALVRRALSPTSTTG